MISNVIAMIDMSKESVSIEELTKKRTPSELLTWVRLKMEQIGSIDDGEKALRLREGLAKQLIEEVLPLALFGWHKFGNTAEYSCNQLSVIRVMMQ